MRTFAVMFAGVAILAVLLTVGIIAGNYNSSGSKAPGKAKKELTPDEQREAIVGSWVADDDPNTTISFSPEGTRSPFIFDTGNGNRDIGLYQFRPDRKPAQLDLYLRGDALNEPAVKMIVEFIDKDHIRVDAADSNAPRPTSFTNEARHFSRDAR